MSHQPVTVSALKVRVDAFFQTGTMAGLRSTVLECVDVLVHKPGGIIIVVADLKTKPRLRYSSLDGGRLTEVFKELHCREAAI